MDSKPPLLIVLCGIPGSGKSTTTEQLDRALSERGLRVSPVKFDDIYNGFCDELTFDRRAWKVRRMM